MNIAIGTCIGAFFLIVGYCLGFHSTIIDYENQIKQLREKYTDEGFRADLLEGQLKVCTSDRYESCSEILTLCSENETIDRSEVVNAYKTCMDEVK